MWDDERIDAAINETARQMTAGEPRADFRVRVMARIDVRSHPTRAWRPVLAGLSVAALVVIGLIVARDHSGPRAIVPAEVRLKPGATDKSVPLTADAAPVRLQADATYESRRVATARLGNDTDNRPSDIEPLTTPPLDLESIAVVALPADESIHIEPLPPAAPIAVTPLDVEIEGDRR